MVDMLQTRQIEVALHGCCAIPFQFNVFPVPLQYHLLFQFIADIINHTCSLELMENIVDLGI